MKTLLLISLISCLTLAAGAQPTEEEIGFTYAPSFSDVTSMVFTKLKNGEIHCVVWTWHEFADADGKNLPTKVKEAPISADVFSGLSALLESSELRVASEKLEP